MHRRQGQQRLDTKTHNRALVGFEPVDVVARQYDRSLSGLRHPSRGEVHGHGPYAEVSLSPQVSRRMARCLRRLAYSFDSGPTPGISPIDC